MAAVATDTRQQQRTIFWQGWLLLLCLVTLFLREPLFTGRPLLAADLLFHLDPLWQPLAPSDFDVPANQVLSDQVFEFYPWQHFIRAELAQARFPLWNPLVYSGQPLLANAQSAIFDPFNVVARLWPLPQSFVVIAWLRLLCAGTFMLLLALALGLSRWAAYLAMVVFTFALPQVVWLQYPKASVLVWMPALLFFSLRVLRGGDWRDVAALALVIAAQLVGGHPETALFSALLWLIFCLYWLERVRVVPTQGRGYALLQLGMAGLLGLGMAAAQWLPTVEGLLQSEILAARNQSTLTWQMVWLQWRDWLAALTLLLPDFFGNPRQGDYWFPYSNYTEQIVYVGLLPLALALPLYFRRDRGREVTFFALLAAVALAFALRVPPFPLLAEAPGLNVTNVARLRHCYMLASALLAGYGLDVVRQSFLRGEAGDAHALPRFRRTLVALGVAAALIALGAYVAVIYFQPDLVALGRAQAAAAQSNPFFFRTPEAYMALAEARVAQMLASFHPSNWAMYLPLILVLVVVASNELMRRLMHQPTHRAQALSIVILVLTVGELWRVGLDYNPTIAPADVYPTPPLVAELLRQDPPRVGPPYRVMGTGLALVPNVSMVFGLADIRGYDPIAPQRYMALVSELPGAIRVGHHLLFEHADARLLDLLGVRYLFSNQALGGRWTPLMTDDGFTVYRNQAAMPAAFMVYRSQVADSPAASLAMTLAPDFDFRNTVILEGEHAPVLQDQPARAPVVEITRDGPGAMTVAVETAQPGLLVVTDPYTSGWVAQVDGADAEILIADHALRAVFVPAGEHIVVFTYRPMSFVVGMWISAASFCVLVLLLASRGWRMDGHERK